MRVQLKGAKIDKQATQLGTISQRKLRFIFIHASGYCRDNHFQLLTDVRFATGI